MGPGVQPLNVTRGHRKAVQLTPYRLLLVMYGNYGPILYGLRDMCNLVENRSFFRIPRVFKSSLGLLSSEIRTPNYSAQKTTMIGLRDGEKKNFGDMFRPNTTVSHAQRDRRTDRQMDRRTDRRTEFLYQWCAYGR